jgi:hypothetical protein
MSRDEALQFLAALSDKEFAELFYEAVRTRNTSDVPEQPGHFVLADATDLSDEGGWRVEFIALPATHVRWDSLAPICQSGQCRNCGVHMRSWSKSLRCPVCGLPGSGS